MPEEQVVQIADTNCWSVLDLKLLSVGRLLDRILQVSNLVIKI
jgi:hypothetical protein